MNNVRTFLGTAATMYLGLGAVPRRLVIENLITGLAPVRWNEGMLADTATAGGIIDAAGTHTPQTAAQGVVPYLGGDVITTLSNNYKLDPLARSDLSSNLKGSATKFYMDTASAGTGHLDAAPASGAGQGSRIVLAWRDLGGNVQQYQGRISYVNTTYLTADYVGLSPSCPTIPATGADVIYIGTQYDLVAAAVGMVMPAGVKLINTTYMTPAVKLAISWE